MKKNMYKVVLLGDPGVGKTSIRKRYMGRGFSTNYLPTMGADFAVHNLTRGETQIEFQIWDLAGQQNFDLLIPRFISNSNAAIFIFDIARRDTFVNLANWIKKFKKINEQNLSTIPLYIVANKSDLANKAVEDDEISQYKDYVKNTLKLEDSNVKAMKTSAKTGANIDELFENLIDQLVE